MAFMGVKRKVFISFHQGDRAEVDQFINRWGVQEGVFIPKSLGTSDNDDFINSSNPEYVMSQIRQKYLEDSSVTIVLLGRCTHSRRYVDWEIKTSLQQGESVPNGLLGIILPSISTGVHLPDRFLENWKSDESNCYAKYRFAPKSSYEIASWIEDAFSARTSRTRLISNANEMMKYNSTCKVCGVTH